jgi:transcription elongation GreA/GreB family factor
MKNNLKLKKELFEACLNFVDNKLETIMSFIKSAANDLTSETKSSAGDKHETGRAMLQLEIEKASQQLNVVTKMKEVLEKISTSKTSAIISLGSLIFTDKANYYLAISAGKITIENIDYFAVSTNSPIGQQLLGKKVGEIISFNNAEILEIN